MNTPKITLKQYMCVATIIDFKRRIFEFDFETMANGHNYTGVPEPENLLHLIAEFVDTHEPAPGDVHRLQTYMGYLQNTILPLWSDGCQAARSMWQSASESEKQHMMDYGSDDDRNVIHQLAKKSCPVRLSEVERSWYLEAFCKQWMREWGDYLGGKFESI